MLYRINSSTVIDTSKITAIQKFCNETIDIYFQDSKNPFSIRLDSQYERDMHFNKIISMME